MTKPKQDKALRIAELERKLEEALAGQAFRYSSADAGLDKASTDHLMASGVVLTLTVLGGRKLFEPVLIRDGLSEALITTLRADLARSYLLAVQQKPKSLRTTKPAAGA